MLLRTLVTGSAGRVGRRILPLVGDLPLTRTDIRELDINDAISLRRVMSEHSQLLHLALPFRKPAWTAEALADAVEMARNVLKAASDSGVRRVILPSSVNAGGPAPLNLGRRLTADEASNPETEWAKTCQQIEGLARRASDHGLEVVSVRLGAVCLPDHPPRDPVERQKWISHEDCAAMFRACLTAPVVPGRFSRFYAVSDLPASPYDTSNPFGWTPRTRSVGVRRSAILALHLLTTSIRGRLRLRTRIKSIASITGRLAR